MKIELEIDRVNCDVVKCEEMDYEVFLNTKKFEVTDVSNSKYILQKFLMKIYCGEYFGDIFGYAYSICENVNGVRKELFSSELYNFNDDNFYKNIFEK